MDQEINRKHDHMIMVKQMVMANDGRMVFGDQNSGQSYALDEYALGQLCSRMGIPSQYIHKCPPELRAINVNAWLNDMISKEGGSKEKEWLVRMVDTVNDQGEPDVKIRAMLSDRYSILDNNMLLHAIPQAITQAYSIEHFHYDDDSDMSLRIIFPGMKQKIGETRLGTDDVLQVGLEIRNSERGSGAVRIDSVVYRLVCTNGMMGLRTDSFFSQRHMFDEGLTTLGSRISKSVTGLLTEGMGNINRLSQAKQIALDTPIEVIERLAKEQKYSTKLTKDIVDSYLFEPDNNAFGVVNAFTRAARSLPIARRIEIEEFAGSILQMKALAS